MENADGQHHPRRLPSLIPVTMVRFHRAQVSHVAQLRGKFPEVNNGESAAADPRQGSAMLQRARYSAQLYPHEDIGG